MTGFFITGTDTGVGKTVVACGLATALRGRGLRVGVMKPVETGCAPHGDELRPADAVRLWEAAGGGQDLAEVCPFRFEAALAPDVAARQSGREIDLRVLHQTHERIAATHDVTLVEGAGGLLVPIWNRYTMADLARDLGLPLLVVVGSRLGAVNHTLLTLELADRRGLSVAGYVLNHPYDADTAVSTNAELLARSTDTPCVGVVPWYSDGSPNVDVATVAGALAVDALLPGA